ncbi:MAG: hypothetical protein HC777_03250 [Hyphomonadaceae bacterium]|nr:hypothetical protein [Hyphomonadaceae bacterium]
MKILRLEDRIKMIVLFPTGEGPPFIKYGPRLVRYLLEALDTWAANRVYANTSQYGR